MKDREATWTIRELAERQHGVVARRQLLELGVNETLIQCRADGGILIPVFQGIFALGHERLTGRGRWMAAVLASGPGAVLSHGSAMELWGIRGSRGPVEVLRRAGGVRERRAGIRLHQTRKLTSREITLEANIPVTSIERALLDMAGRLDVKQQERALVEADRGGRLRWPELARLLARGRGRKGVGGLRRVAMEVDPRAADVKSPLEADFLVLCREVGLPLPQVNVLVEGYLVDFYWPLQRVVVETDSYTYHANRPSFEGDHERTVALTAAGYDVHRATYQMLNCDPDPFLAVVRRSLRSRQHRTASTSRSGRQRS
jgi:uncharacterized protein DUF559